MNIIVAVDKNWTIGCKGKLLYKLPLDMRFFKETTMGKTIIVGRKTLESFPNQEPLPKRLNIILSKTLAKENPQKYTNFNNSLVVSSIPKLFEVLKNFSQNDLYIVGGETIYEQLLPYAKLAYVTKIDSVTTFKDNLNYFENLDTNPSWKLIEESPTQITNNIEIQFCKYENLLLKTI